MTGTAHETDWLEFKAMHDQAGVPPCPFCGVQHNYSRWHPFCDMATQFRFWLQAGKPRKDEGESE